MKISQNIDSIMEEKESQTDYKNTAEIESELIQIYNELTLGYSQMRQILYNKRSILYKKLYNICLKAASDIELATQISLDKPGSRSLFYDLFEDFLVISHYSKKIGELNLIKSEDCKKENTFISKNFSKIINNIKKSITQLSDDDFDLIKKYKKFGECLIEVSKNSTNILDITQKIISLSNIDISEVKIIIEYFESEVEDSKKYFRNNNKENINKVEEAKIIENPPVGRKFDSEICF